MPEPYSKHCQISKMVKDIENPGIIRTVYSDIFACIQRHSAIFSHVQANIQTCSGILRASLKGF